MKSTQTLMVAAALIVTLAGTSLAQTTTKRDVVSRMDKKFMTTAAQGGIFEVQSSQVALNKTKNPRVRAIAARMVKEHSAANKELATVAMDKKYKLPKETDAKHQTAIRRMKTLSGTAFDKSYMASQEVAHAATVKLFQSEIATGLDKDVTAFATKNLPTIEDHTTMIFQVCSILGVHAAEMPALKGGMMPSSMSGRHMH